MVLTTYIFVMNIPKVRMFFVIVRKTSKATHNLSSAERDFHYKCNSTQLFIHAILQ